MEKGTKIARCLTSKVSNYMVAPVFVLFLYGSFQIVDATASNSIDYGVDIDQHLIESVKLNPFVVAMEDESMTLEIKVTDSSISSIEILNGFCQQLAGGGSFDGFLLPNDESTITLYDDGSHGDKVPDDLVFTFDSISFSKKRSASNSNEPNKVRKTTWKTGGVAENWHRGREQNVKLSFTDGTSRDTTIHMDHSCGGINLDYVPIPEITELDSTSRASAHVVSITGFQKQTLFPHYYAAGTLYNHSEVTKKLYNYVEDDYDWIIIQDVSSGRAQQYHPVSRNEEGVYEYKFDSSSLYGSEGKLRGILYDQSYWEQILDRNFQANARDYSSLNHEISHAWLSYLPTSLSISRGGHYGYIKRDSSCLNGNGVWTQHNIEFNESAGIAYLQPYYYAPNGRALGELCNDLELYLMGLLPKTEVLPLTVVVNPGQYMNLGVNEVPGFTGYVSADAVQSVSIDEIIQTVGDRVPSSVESQKNFKALMVVVHDRLLTDNEMALFEYRMQDYEKNRSEYGKTFALITHDLATISTKVKIIDPGSIYLNGFE